MARRVRMPTEEQLPSGSRRRFVSELFERYREADRPSLREISDAIAGREDRRGTASPETVRRMLNGTTVPGWRTVEAVLVALCDLAGTDPDNEYYDSEDINREATTFRRELKYLWNRAVDFPDEYDAPMAVRAVDSWAASDEPPF